MIEEGEEAPTFTAAVAEDGELGTFGLTDRLDEAPLVLAFFPAAFSGTCTDEMAAFDQELARFADRGATVYGISTDLPWALREFAAREDLAFGLIGDHDRTAIEAYGVELAFESLALEAVADRAVVVIDRDRTVTYTWRADEPSDEPPYDAVLDATSAAADPAD